jgi:hypothetical protein
MLGSLARKLRMYGFDTIYDAKLNDAELIKIAESQNRTLLTSDRELFLRATNKSISAVLIVGDNDAARLAYVFSSLQIAADLNPEKSRCPVCNGLLEGAIKSSLTNVPKTVLERQERFYVCKSCGKVYWRGSHWQRMKSMANIVEKMAQT